MKRILVGMSVAVVAAVAAVLVWFYASSNVEDPDVTAAALASSETSTAGSATAVGGDVFELNDESTVTFEIGEELRGSPMTVEATNTEVAAQLSFDPDDLAATELGTVTIGATTFETDSGNRNRAIRGPILDSGEHPLIEFAPASIDGLDGSIGTGDSVRFTVTGDLTIRDITTSVTFEVDATYTSEARVEGSASATVSRTDFDLSIPSAPGVANVSEEVLLRIDFVATPVA